MILLLAGLLANGTVWLKIAASDDHWRRIFRSIDQDAAVLLSSMMSLVTSLILFFAGVYWSMSSFNPRSFGHPLTKGDAVGVTIGILSTNGPGIYYPRTPSTRGVSYVQMMVDLLLLLIILAVAIGRFGISGAAPLGDNRGSTTGTH
jgi:hypothetical protein